VHAVTAPCLPAAASRLCMLQPVWAFLRPAGHKALDCALSKLVMSRKHPSLPLPPATMPAGEPTPAPAHAHLPPAPASSAVAHCCGPCNMADERKNGYE